VTLDNAALTYHWVDIPQTLGKYMIMMVAVKSKFPGDPLSKFYFAQSRSVPPTTDVRLTIGLLDLNSKDLNAWEYFEPEILPFAAKKMGLLSLSGSLTVVQSFQSD
jgi:hypothetical protein